MKTTSKRNWVVIVSGNWADDTAVYIGELDPGVRQGVKKLENATRFTQRGAMRVLNAYKTAVGEGYIMQVAS